MAFFSHFRDHSLKTPHDIEEKLGLKALASIPHTSI
jgi:capsular polysaccharide biosynthesis protein